MLTLRALLNDATLALNVLEPGLPGALDAEARWVHNTELPDPSPYVREGELVLTNGLWRDRVTPREFVDNVRRAHAAGIVFGLRAQTPHTPRELIDACRAVGLPLLEIGIEVPFTAISRAAATIYAEDRQNTLMGLVRRGDALAGTISRGAGASGVLRVLRRDHELPLAVVDRMGRLLAMEVSGGGELAPEALSAVADGLGRHPPPLELDLGESGRAAMFLVGAVGDVDAALLCLRPVAELDRDELDALEQAARFLSLEVARQQAVHAIEQRFASELLDMILSGSARAVEVPGRLRAFGIDPTDRLVVCALAFADAEAATLPGLAEAVSEFFVTESIPVVAAGGSQDVVAVLPWRRPDAELPAMATRLAETVRARFAGHHPVVGLGGLATDAGALRATLMRARETCRVLRRRRGGPQVATFAELSTHRLLLGLHDTRTLHAFADSVLGPLRAHDTQRGSELETTLRAFLDHEGHWAATAAALYIHVNTLRNRLARVTELTGRDVGRTEDRVDLFLALEADAMS